MSQRTFCDGCGAEAPHLLKRDAMGRCPSIGQPGDGIKRQLELRFGTSTMTLDLCVTCFARARSWLVEAFPEMARTLDEWWRAMGVEGMAHVA